MLLPILIIIIFVLFMLWVVFVFYKLAFLALVNFVVGAMISLRMYHDLKIKKYIQIYITAAVISAGIIIAGLTSYSVIVYKFLSRFMLLEAVQILAVFFLVAQCLIWLKKSHN